MSCNIKFDKLISTNGTLATTVGVKILIDIVVIAMTQKRHYTIFKQGIIILIGIGLLKQMN